MGKWLQLLTAFRVTITGWQDASVCRMSSVFQTWALQRLFCHNPHTHVLIGFCSFILLLMWSFNHFSSEVPSDSGRIDIVPGGVNQKIQFCFFQNMFVKVVSWCQHAGQNLVSLRIHLNKDIRECFSLQVLGSSSSTSIQLFCLLLIYSTKKRREKSEGSFWACKCLKQVKPEKLHMI